MALTINEMARQRRSAVRKLSQELKGINTMVERSNRRIKRVLSRNRKVPELKDLDSLAEELVGVQREMDEYAKAITAAFQIFTMV